MTFKRKCFSSFYCIFLAISLISCSTVKTKYHPASDEYWSSLVNEATTGKKSIIATLEKENPSLYKQILNDSKDPIILKFWGQSLNFDSGAKKQIIDDQLMTDLQAQFGIKNDNKIVHAGITHTYGYLFSILDTPYGYKRKRWVDPTLNYAFEFKGNALSPETQAGGLLSNITYFAGKIAFNKLQNVSSEVLNFNYRKIAPTILEEQIIDKGAIAAILRTTLVGLPLKRVGEQNDYLLIYSLLNPKNNKEVLITAFPIKIDAYKIITALESTGVNKPIIIRYNAYLEGFMDRKLTGIKNLLKHSDMSKNN